MRFSRLNAVAPPPPPPQKPDSSLHLDPASSGDSPPPGRRVFNRWSILLCLPLLLGLAVPGEAQAQTSCTLTSAISEARGAYNFHRVASNNNATLSDARVFYRALITLGVSPLPAWEGSNISGNAPTTEISAAEVRTARSGRTWGGWDTILTALDCLEAEAALPAITISADAASVTEGTAASFTLTATPAPAANLTVTLAITESGDSVASGDKGTQTVTIGTSGSATHAVPTVDDTTEESGSSVTATVNSGTGYRLGNPFSARVSVNDDDKCNPSNPCITVTGTSPVTEGPGVHAVFTIHADPAPSSNLPVTIAVGERCDFVASGAIGVKTITINSGRTSATHRVPIHNDNINESKATEDTDTAIACHVGVEIFSSVGSGYQYKRGLITDDMGRKRFQPQMHIAYIIVIDDDPLVDPILPQVPEITVRANTASVTEGTAASFTVTASPASTSALTVNLIVAEDKTQGRDFVATTNLGTPTVTIPANQSSATHTVPTVGDSTDEPNGSLTVTVNAGTGYIGSSTSGSATVTINDDDGPAQPAASFASASASAAESAGTHNVAVNLSSAAPSGGLALSYSVAGTATAGSGNDFTIQNSGTLSVVAGANTASILVAINDDSSIENAETVILTLTGGTGYTLGNPTAHTLTITDNDAPPGTPVVSIAGGSAVAEGGDAVFTVTATPAPTGTITVNVNVADSGDFAVSGQTGTRTVVLASGSTTFRVTTDDDSTDEPNGRITATAQGGTGYSVGSPASGTVAVNDNDVSPGTPGLVLGRSSLTVSEGGTGRYTVKLATQPTGAVTVAVASDNADVTANPASLTFNPSGGNLWSTAQTVTVSASRDIDTATDSATLTHTASGGGYGSVAAASVRVAVNDDGSPMASFASASGSTGEDAGTRNVRVNLRPAPASSITVTYTVTGTATEADDFTIQNSGSLSVAANGSFVNIPVAITDDGDEENAETVILTLTGGTGYEVGSPGVHTLTITSSDHAPVAQDSEVRVPAEGAYAFKPEDFRYTDADGDPLQGVTVVTLPQAGALTLGGMAVSEGDPAVARADLSAGRLVYTPAEGQSGKASFTFRVNDGTEDEGHTATMTLTLVSLDAQRLTRGWLARFGRAAADQVIGAVEERLRAPMAERSAWRLAGRDWPAQNPDPNALAPSTGETGSGILADTLDALPEPSRAFGGLPSLRETAPTGLSGLDWLGGSSFNITRQSGSGLKSVWGRGAVTQFDAREADARLDGRVASVLLGADFVQDGHTLGILLSHSRGKGGYQGKNTGDRLEADLTGAYPYARYEVNERLSLWGVAGYGEGDLERIRDAQTQKADLESWMAAGGLRGQVRGATALWPELSAVADVLWVDTQTDGEADFSAVDADVSRIRAGLEGSWAPTPLGPGQLSPRLRISLRHDGGDAEHGFGTEVRAGADWVDARHGLKVQLQAHTLLTHEEDGAQEKGISGSVAWDPRPGSLRGAEFSLAASTGAQPDREGLLSGATFGRDPARESAPSWEATLGYGVGAFGDRFTAVPEVNLAWSADAWDLGLGWRLVAERFDLRLQAQHRAASGEDTGFGLDLSLQGRW